MPAQSETERRCLERLTEMDTALARMTDELPDDVLPLGQRAREQVHLWQQKLGQGGADLASLSEAMREISTLMEALAARLLLQPWEHAGRPPRSN